MEFRTHPKEKLYFTLMAFISLILYAGLGALFYYNKLLGGIYLGYALVILAFSYLISLVFIGFLKGNTVKVSEQQFSDLYKIAQNHAQALDMPKVPDIYIMQSGGVLNAFATRFSGRNFVILYSATLEAGYQEGMEAVSFILGHELGHIKQGHVSFWWTMLIWPAQLIPFLGSAYSRVREYTCDNIGYNLSPEGAIPGMLILATGAKLYKKVDVAVFTNQMETEWTFAAKFSELLSNHPALIKRIKVLSKLGLK